MKNKYILAVSIAIIIFISSILLASNDLVQSDSNQTDSEFGNVMETFGTKHIVPLEKIKNNGVPRDGIPPLFNPRYVSAGGADFMADEHLVIGLNLNGQARAYPHFILVWHEIVNEEFGDIPVAVTYCPLCFTSQVFDRRLDGMVLDFGNTGNLYNSNLVMYDKNTESQWSQSLGMAITGDLSGKKLKKLPFDVVSWGTWKTLYPDTVVLSLDTGYSRPYGSNPYKDYFTNKNFASPIDNYDERLHPKEIVIGLEHDGYFKAYEQNDIESLKTINDKINGKSVLLVSPFPYLVRIFDRTLEDQTLEFFWDGEHIIDKQTGSVWNLEGESLKGEFAGKKIRRLSHDPGFWFEWSALHPKTEIYDSETK